MYIRDDFWKILDTDQVHAICSWPPHALFCWCVWSERTLTILGWIKRISEIRMLHGESVRPYGVILTACHSLPSGSRRKVTPRTRNSLNGRYHFEYGSCWNGRVVSAKCFDRGNGIDTDFMLYQGWEYHQHIKPRSFLMHQFELLQIQSI